MSAYAQITGHLGQDVELRQTNGGIPVVNLSLASQRKRKDGNGERVNLPDWFRVTVFGRDAEVLAQHAHKGSAITFNGRLQMEAYFDRAGAPRSTPILIADSFEFMPRVKRSSTDETNARNGDRAENYEGAPKDDDIPF
jgi:single-strand DNA-binding protein